MTDDSAGDEFHLFIKAVKDSDIELQHGTDLFHPLVRTLMLWAESHGFVSTATWTKKLLVALARPGGDSLNWGPNEGANLLTCFGRAFRGDEVGHIGRDLVEPCLHHSEPGMVEAALEVLKAWRDDEEGAIWQQLLEQQSDFEDEGVRQLEIRGLETGPADGAKDPSAAPGNLSGFDEALRGPELELYFAATRKFPNSCRALVLHPELPGFLAKSLGIDLVVTLGLLESQKIGTSCVPASSFDVHIDGLVVRAWNAEMTVSIEPTASSKWLVVARWASP